MFGRLINLNSLLILKRHNIRNFYWTKYKDGIYTIGLKNETLNLHSNIDYVEFNKELYVNQGDTLCLIGSDTFTNNIISPFNCKIYNKNYNILRTINIDAEREDESWIIKLQPLIYNRQRNFDFDIAKYIEYIKEDQDSNKIPVYALKIN